MSEKLKPCPFCGSKAESYQWGGRNSPTSVEIYKVICLVCLVETHGFRFEEEAIRAWNRRLK